MGSGSWAVPLFYHAHVLALCRGGDRRLAPARQSAAPGRPDGPELDYIQCHSASSCGTGARRPRTMYQGRSPTSSSHGSSERDTGRLPGSGSARACLGLPISPWNPSRLAMGIARGGGGSWKRDTDRRPGSGSGQLSWSYSLNLISESPGPGRQRRASEPELNEN